jgi:hypothetical protein
MLIESLAAGALVFALLAATVVGIRRRRADLASGGDPASTLHYLDRGSAGSEGTYHGAHWLGGSSDGGGGGGAFDGGGGSPGGGGFDGGGSSGGGGGSD